MKRSLLLFVALSLSVSISVSLTLFGQSSNAKVSGTISDVSGAVLPGVSVTAANTATGVVATVVSNDAGAYNFASLLPGVYKISAELPGFQIQRYTDVQLGNAAQVRLNFSLSVAQVNTAVEVSVAADKLLVESSSSVGQVLPENKVRDLPLISNNVLDLVSTLSGVTVTSSPIFGAESTSFAGVSARDINVQRDGVSVNNQRWPNGLESATRLSPDLVGEIKLILAPVDAEMGRGNGQVQIQTKSGTNAFHGAGVWDVQNSALDANTWENNRSAVTPAWRNLNEYTGSLGGPIVKNKTFFFALWDGQISRLRDVQNPVVLTPCAAKGIFRYFDNVSNGNALSIPVAGATPTVPVVDRLGNPVTNLGPLRYASVFGTLQNTPKPDCSDAVVTGSPWDANRRRMDPTGYVTNTLFKFMPPVNNYDVGDGLNTAGSRWVRTLQGSDNLFGIGEPTQRKQINFRIDHTFNTSHKISGSYSYETDRADDSYINWPNTYGGSVEKRPQVFAVNFTSTFSPRVVNEARVGMSRTGVNVFAPLDNPGTGEKLKALLPKVNGETVAPTLGQGAVNFQIANVIGSRGLVQVSNRDLSPRYIVADSISWLQGKHAFKSGAEYRHGSSKSSNGGAFFGGSIYPFAVGGAGFLSPVTGINNTNMPGLAGTAFTGNVAAMQDLLVFLSGSLANVNQYRFLDSAKDLTAWNDPSKGTFKVRDIHQNEFSTFFKDDWKVNSDLTLNLGVRWDYYGVPYEKTGLTAALKGGGNSLFGYSGRSFADWMKPGQRGELTALEFVGPNSSNPNGKVYPSDWNNVGPAIGFAYQVPWFGKGKTTVRGGYQLQFVGGGRANTLDTIIGNPPGSSTFAFYFGDSATTYLDMTSLSKAVPPVPTSLPLQPIPITDRTTASITAFDAKYVSPYIQNLTMAVTRTISSNLTLDLRYVGTLTRKNYGQININVPNFRTNGLKEAFDAARRGGESQLLDDMFRGINIAGEGYGPVGSLTNGVLQTGAMHLRAATAAPVFFAPPINVALANGNYQSLANSLNVLNYSNLAPGNATLPFIPGGVNGAVLRFSGKFPENFIKTNPQLNNAVLETNSGYSNYHSLQTEINLRPVKGVSVSGTYTWSKNLGLGPLTNPGTGTAYTDPTDRAADYTLLPSDRRHVFRTYGSFDLPFGPSRSLLANSTGILARIVEGWQTSWIVNLASGSPANILAQNNLYNQGVPDIVGPFNLDDAGVTWADGARDGNYFARKYSKVLDPQCAGVTTAQNLRASCTLNAIANTSGQIVLQNPAPGTRGNFGQNRISNAGIWSADMAIAKRVKVGESKSVTVRLDARNIFNHPTPGITPFGFGVAPIPGGSDLDLNSFLPFGSIPTKGATTPQLLDCRTFQLKARFDF